MIIDLFGESSTGVVNGTSKARFPTNVRNVKRIQHSSKFNKSEIRKVFVDQYL